MVSICSTIWRSPRRLRRRVFDLDRVRCEVTALQPVDLKGPVIIRAQHRQWLADQVVLACGDAPPIPRHYAAEVQDHPAYIYQPFEAQLTQPGDRRVLIIGTGPTMADISAAVVAAHPQLELLAVSRHGLLPQPQITGAGAPGLAGSASAFEVAPGASLRQIVSRVRSYLELIQTQGVDWRDALVALRKHIPALWEGLGEADRSRFLRHVRTYWDIHRHRLAPEIAASVAHLRANGQLRVHAGRILHLAAEGSGISAQWSARGSTELRQLRVDRIIDCSGADCRVLRTRDPLLRQLMDTGVASSDPNGLGLRTGKHGALINGDGDAAQQVFYLGPMLRARHWEATAVGELRQHVDTLAEVLRDQSIREPALELSLRPSRFGFAGSQPSP